ncbi:MAG: MATE family efflux transporter [Lachnospiraceae bacterium]|nr:MATE family efflux transporter [Lachnospiraceae bacterium]
MSASKVRDMTQGNITEHLLKFAFPLFIGNLFQQLYNMVDSFVVGNYVGASSLAAIGTCGSLNFLFISLSMGLANGVGIIVAQYFGAGDHKGIKSTVTNAYYLIIGASFLATTVGFIYAEDILKLMNTPEDILPESTLYLSTTVFGIIFIALYNSVASVLRALGDSKTPLYFLILSSLLNVVLDLLFVLRFDMGVRGAAIATIISQAVAALVSLSYAFIKLPYYRAEKEFWKPHRGIIFHSIKLGVPMALQSSMIALSMIVLQGVVNTFGATVMAVYTISAKVDLIISQLYGAMSFALITFSGQNYGAGNAERIKAGFKRGLAIVEIYNAVMIPIVLIFSKSIVNIFVNDPEVIEIGTTALRITGIMYLFLGVIYVPRGVLNGVGDAAFSMINGITEVFCRILYSNLLTGIALIGMWGIWWAAGLTWATVSVVCILRYRFGPWRKKIASSGGSL